MIKIDKFDAALASIILIINEENFIKFSQLSSYDIICKELFKVSIPSFHELKSAQKKILKQYQSLALKTVEIEFLDALATLHENNIIDTVCYKKLKDVLSLHEEIKTIKVDKPRTNSFHENINSLLHICDSLDVLIESDALKNRVDGAKQSLQAKSFSIGVTGVIKAGKSTLLNALLKKDILGTAVIPETANLSVIKYSERSYVKVHFWNKKNWEKIEKSALVLKNMQKFIQETKEHFKETMGEFITQEGKSIQIDISELSSYTSAIKSDKKCNLVERVEIFENFALLKDGVSIVDTPGLDDPVIEREEITKHYLNECDLLIHLMNSAQSATNKDIEFIIDALTYQGISRLLIVLTRVDTISDLELQEVISYTKKSIIKELQKHNKESLFNSILEKIEFMPVSGKLALMHRTGKQKEALKLGFNEEQTGILKLEQYLNDVLFGKNSQKASLLVKSNTKILFLAINEAIISYKNQSKNLNKSSHELEKELAKQKELNEKEKKKIDAALQILQKSKDELDLYAQTLLHETYARTKSLSSKIFGIIYDDVKYELNKNNKKPQKQRISYFIESGIKDGILDLIRDYRFTFSKKLIETKEKMEVYFKNINTHEEQNSFDVKTFFSIHNNIISSSHQVLIANVLNSIDKTSKKELKNFTKELDEFFTYEFKKLNDELLLIFKKLNQTLLHEFEGKNKEPLDFIINMMKDDERSLLSQIELLGKSAHEGKKRDKKLQEKILKLTLLKEKLPLFEDSI